MKTVYFALTLLILTSLACSLGGQVPARGAEPTADVPFNPQIEPTASPSAAESLPATATAPLEPTPVPVSQCANPYYPIAKGATWKYQLSGMSADTFVRSIPNVRENGFDDQDVFSSGTTRQGSWECQQGNLISLTPNSGGAAVLAEGVQAIYTIESTTGISFPADPQPGQEWTQKTVYLGQENTNGLNIQTRNVMNLACKVIGAEKVSVPAGDFETLRIDCSTKIDIFVSGNLAFSFTSTTSAWHAQGVGLVKSSGSSNMGSTETVLLSYTIP
jgi:hypothetical protein